MKGLERLSVISELSRTNTGWKHKELFRILHKEDIWIAAYENLEGNKGALTPGVTKETLDGIGMVKLQKIQKKVLEESYQFSPVEQIWIPKANGKRRPLGLPTPDDKIVQEVIRMVLTAIYEPVFDDRSFGFRSGIGVHDALQYVEKEFRWMDWVLKGDIKDAYPTIEHKTLCEILSRTIEDQRFLNLIQKSFKGGIYVNPETLYSKIGVPQGSIVSPILANIYYHELDTWVTQKGKEVYSEKSTKRHQEYKRLEYQIQKVSKQIEESERNSEQRANLVRKIKRLIQQRNQTPSLLDQGIEIRYVRYADDWMIGIKGPRKIAEQIKEDATEFLRIQLKQELDPVKTKIIDLRAGKVHFLGYEIFLARNMKLVKYKRQEAKQTIRRSTRRLRFQVPVEKILKRLKERGYIAHEDNKFRPVSKRSYAPLEDEVIVNHFRSVWIGLLNFYSGTTNLSHLQYIHYLLHMSCAMTLAHRHRTSSSKIFKKHGKRLEIMEKRADISKRKAYFPYQTSWKISDRKWYSAKTFIDPFTIYANRVSKSRLEKPCCICQIETPIEMHHVKHVRKKGFRYQGFHAEMALLNRKQVPLCRNCHMAVHRGEFDGIRLSTLD
jgi:group II intron reverse transcriptase/maturase